MTPSASYYSLDTIRNTLYAGNAREETEKQLWRQRDKRKKAPRRLRTNVVPRELGPKYRTALLTFSLDRSWQSQYTALGHIHFY